MAPTRPYVINILNLCASLSFTHPLQWSLYLPAMLLKLKGVFDSHWHSKELQARTEHSKKPGTAHTPSYTSSFALAEFLKGDLDRAYIGH